MADTFLLEIATPERQMLKEQVTEAQIPGEDGYMGILPGHAPLVSRLKPGVLSYNLNGKEEAVAIQGGFVEVGEVPGGGYCADPPATSHNGSNMRLLL